MEDKIFDAVFILNEKENITEFRVPANNIIQRNGWVLARWYEEIVGGAKEEYLKAFCLELRT